MKAIYVISALVVALVAMSTAAPAPEPEPQNLGNILSFKAGLGAALLLSGALNNNFGRRGFGRGGGRGRGFGRRRGFGGGRGRGFGRRRGSKF